MFLEIWQNSRENTCTIVSFFKRWHWNRCFPGNFAEFIRTHFLKNTSGNCFCNYLRKQTLKSLFVRAFLYFANDRVQSKMLDVSFFNRVSFWDKIGCFVTRLCRFAHLYICYSPTHFINLQQHQIYCGRDPGFTYSALFLS